MRTQDEKLLPVKKLAESESEYFQQQCSSIQSIAESKLKSTETETPPKDEGSSVMRTQFLYGFSMLLTFNLILSSLDFFQLKMPDYQPLSTYPFAMNSSLFIGGLYFTFNGSKLCFSTTIVLTFILQGVIMLILPLTANLGGAVAYWLCFLELFIYGLLSGICQSACYSYNAKLPARYIAVFLTSHGVAGIFSNVLRLVSLFIWPVATEAATSAEEVDTTNALKSCMFIQCSGVMVVLMCVPAQLYLNKNTFANYYFYENTTALHRQSEQQHSSSESGSDNDFHIEQSEQPTQQEGEGSSSLLTFIFECRQAFKMTRGLLTALCFIFLLTFVVFPGLAIACPLSFLTDRPGSLAWLNLVILTAFNVFDTLGRYLAGVTSLSRVKTIVLSYLRSVQMALFLLSAFEVGFFATDGFKLVNFSIFAFSNGYLSSLCSIKAPDVVKTGEQRGSVGAFIGVTKLLGILVGSTLAIPLKEVIKLTPAYQTASI